MTPDGRPAIVEALRPCVVTVSLWEEGRLTERDRRELEPGEFAKVVPTAAPRPSPMRLVPPPGETEAGRTHATMFQLGFSLDDRTGLGAFPCWWTKSTAPWARVQFSELPPSPADIADGASIVLAAVGVADAPETDASLRLELAFPPRVGGAGAAGAGPHLSALVLGVAAR